MGEETTQGRVPKSIRSEGNHSGFGTPVLGQVAEPEFPPGSLWNQSVESPLKPSEPGKDTKEDPALFDLPKGVSLSTGPYTQDGIYITGAPEHSAFRFFQTAPRVEGRLISRHGKLFIRQEDGTLTEPPPELKLYSWVTTTKTHRLLPKHFNGADSAKPLPNLGKTEDWHYE